jgi:hypothetical protein
VAVVADTKMKAGSHFVGILGSVAVDGPGILDEWRGEAFDRQGQCNERYNAGVID